MQHMLDGVHVSAMLCERKNCLVVPQQDCFDANDSCRRTVSAALYNITIQLSGIAGSNIYRKDDKPLYRRGNSQLIAINVATIFAYILAKTYYVVRNKWKKEQWEKLTAEEKATYLQTTSDQGNKRLDFQFDS